MNGIQGKNGELWCYLARSLCKNIMLAAYRTPSTAEQLAMKWALLMNKVDNVCHEVVLSVAKEEERKRKYLGRWGATVRPDGGEWDILGMEVYNGISPYFVGLHGCVSNPDEKDLEEICFRQFKFQYKNIADKTPFSLTYLQGKALLERIYCSRETI